MAAPDVDVTLTDPAAIVHIVADLLAGRCVQLTFASDIATPADPTPHAPGSVAVHVAAAEVIGCALASDRSPWVSCVHADTGEFFSVPWVDLLTIGRTVGGQPAYALRKRLITVSRLFGHTVEITTLDQWRVRGTVIGFEYDPETAVVEVIVEPTDDPRRDIPGVNEYSVPMDQVDTISDLGT